MKKVVTNLPPKPKYPPTSPIQVEGEQNENTIQNNGNLYQKPTMIVTKKDAENANRLCILSIVFLITSVVLFLTSAFLLKERIVLSFVGIGILIGSVVSVILARTKNPTNKLARNLIIVNIITLIFVGMLSGFISIAVDCGTSAGNYVEELRRSCY